ncbi:fibronectin type III domain-containing protein [Terriglobus albidus]|uniref:fibronectin type III domain-containing protein n=1 Tax=Terriglobus albidus TaxID=1592106 RepID=UPI0021DF7C90|nr:hypothetical protein [Terriglobus albidus]
MTLHLTLPKTTTDNEPLDRDSSVEICRSEGTSECAPVIKVPISKINDLRDTLPQTLASGAAVEVHYQVRITNAAGRAAGWSKPVTVAGGDAPDQIQGLQASLGGTGLLLRWAPSAAPCDEIRIERIEPDRAQPKKKTSIERKREQQQIVLAVPATQGDPGGAVDATAEAGQRYVYRLERRRRLRLGTDEIWVAGAATELDTGVLRDTTPPAVPQSLEALSSESGISLSWQPGTETDLAGYVVYRVDDSGELRLTAMPVTAPQFTDTTAIKGKQYRYRVAAVDRAGNESAKSEPVTEEMR